jgi:hypothetical protein
MSVKDFAPLLAKLDAVDAGIMVYVGGAYTEVKDAKALSSLLNDPVLFMADHWGINRATMNTWLDWTRDKFRCGGNHQARCSMQVRLS